MAKEKKTADKAAASGAGSRLLERIKRSSHTERLILCLMLIAIVLGIVRTCEIASCSWAAHDAAVTFARGLRELESYAREHNCFVNIQTIPAVPGHRCAYIVTSRTVEVQREEFPERVFVLGKALIDPQGVPRSASTFVFKCGDHSEKVVIDVKGSVIIP